MKEKQKPKNENIKKLIPQTVGFHTIKYVFVQ